MEESVLYWKRETNCRKGIHICEVTQKQLLVLMFYRLGKIMMFTSGFGQLDHKLVVCVTSPAAQCSY